ncbi:ABC transporter ATP-binding protein [Isobaculum melis]|uniref:ATP-binding cassette, subfamily B, multidrug efflux pump n=1 Tax=Isobaculum melis TaxID=142588 RepID=A0A1H9QF36_9LACT|nr:ABC transporter ATP-binding protein [Isobaculum melis]SER58479.1 ATP-binding cassette, subfamily B, multidrug efflux pump [Isobaculum melis]
MKGFGQIKRLARFVKPYQAGFILSMVLTFISVLANALSPFIMGFAITRITENSIDIMKKVPGAKMDFPYIGKIIVITLIVAAVYQLTQYLSMYVMTEVVQNTMFDLRKTLEEKINRLPVSYFDRNQQGNILGRVTNDVDAISVAMQQGLIQIVTAVLGITFAVVMMLVISPMLTAIAIFIIPGSILMSKFLVKKSQDSFAGMQNALGDLNGNVQESYSGFSVIKLYGKEADTVRDFKKINHRLSRFGFRAAFISGLMMPLVGLVTYVAYGGVAVLGCYLAIQGILTIGQLQAFSQYIWQINQPVSQMTQISGMLQSAMASATRVFEILDEAEEVPDLVELPLPENIEGHVSFEHVRFGYNEEKPLIKDLSFEVKSGQTVAIVGPTGAGKTTLINLLMRFYDIDGGAIKIDGISTKDMKRSDVRSLFGMVLQDAWLYHDTVSENIRFGKLDATEYEVVDAAKTANVHHFIRTLPDGYEMKLNQEASNISLGQKQLLTIARAVISDPKILILDEATSSVDTRLEALIQKAMKRVMEGRTSFVIAHRLSTIRDADLILVMNQGEIIEQGTHDSLLADGGFYEKLYKSQFSEEVE